MSKLDSLLKNIECEYKYSLNQACVKSFMSEFCSLYNEQMQKRFAKILSADFVQNHKVEDFFAKLEDVHVETLCNEYFDTEDDDLFKEFRAGLRLRRSNRYEGCEQTIKFQNNVNGAAHTHFEYNASSKVDLKVPEAKLFKAIPEARIPSEIYTLMAEKGLIAKYKTDFTRQSLVLTVPKFVTFEVALDQGMIVAGTNRAPICEIEFELKEISKDYIDECWGKTIYDLDDIRLEFSAFIDQLLLKLSHPSVCSNGCIDEEHKQLEKVKSEKAQQAIIACDESDEEFAEAFKGIENVLCDKESEADGSEEERSYIEEGIFYNEPDYHTVERVCECHKGGFIGLEPFSKLRRAVLLAKCGDEDPALMRADLQSLRGAIRNYRAIEKPSFEDFATIVNHVSNTFADVVGYANLFGKREHIEDVRDFVKMIMESANNAKSLTIKEMDSNYLHKIRQDPELKDLSMLTVLECSSMFIELNSRLWFEPFYRAISDLCESDNVDRESFKRLCRTTVGNSFAIKSSEFFERIQYILKRQKLLLCGEEVDYKRFALASQHQMRKAWGNVKFCA